MICGVPADVLTPAHAGIPELRVVEGVVDAEVVGGPGGPPIRSGGRVLTPMAGTMVAMSEMLLRALQTHY